MKSETNNNSESLQENANTKDKQNLNSEIIKRTDIKDTPFTVISTEEGSFLIMGRYRLTEAFKTEEEVIEEANKMTWNRIVQVIMLLWQQLNENNKQ